MHRAQRAAIVCALSSRTPRPLGLHVRLDNVVMSATLTAPVAGSLDVTLDGVVLSADVTAPVSGGLDVTLDGVTLEASGEVGDAPGSTATFTASPASFDDRDTAWHQGLLGATSWGEYWRIPTEADPDVGEYIYFTLDGAGVDPGDHVAELAGYTGHVVDLAGPQVTAADRATAVRALSISGLTFGGSGADVTVTGSIGTCTVGGMHGATELGAAGTRRQAAQFESATLSGRVCQSFTWGGGDVVPTALGLYLGATPTDVRLGLYSGGTAGAGGHTSAALIGEVLIAGGGSAGWHWGELPPAAVVAIANGDALRIVAKSNGTSIPGYISIGDLTGTDFANNLEVLSGGSTDPSTGFESSLAGDTADNSIGVYLMVAMQYRSLDGTDVDFVTRWGLQIPDPTTLDQVSSLVVPDAGGAELWFGAPPPPLLGMVLDTYAIGFGPTHATQLRAAVAQGGSVGDSNGADVLWQAQTSGSATDAWAEFAIPGSIAVDPSDVLHWGAKNNAATVGFRFALNANRELADPIDNPCDYTDASEFEIFSTSGAYDTNPANAIASPIDQLTATVANNTNYAAGYLRLRVPGSTVA